MTKLIIEGGVPLKGEVTLAGAKNSGFKLLIASLLSNKPSRLSGYSRIGDIEITKTIIEALGGRVKKNKQEIEVFPQTLSSFNVPCELGKVSRACTLFAAPLLFHFGKAVLPMPGGDKIGKRPIDRHLDGLRALGAKVVLKNGLFEIRTPEGLKGARFKFAKPTHTGTETLLMAAVCARGGTILENAAQEPEIDDLISFLNKMGGKVKREGRVIRIKGVRNLTGAVHEIMPDRNEAATFAVAGLATGGEIFVKRANAAVLTSFLEKVKEVGGSYKIEKGGIRFWRQGSLKAVNIVTCPYPGFSTDWQALWTVLMTQAQGLSTVHETIFENRFGYVADLIRMGARIELFNPKVKNPAQFYNFNWEDNKARYQHAAKIFGPLKLQGAKLEIGDIRAGATLILASLAAKGKSELSGVEHVDRGYENLDGRLQKLGAKIKRI